VLTWKKHRFLILQGNVLTRARWSEKFWYAEMRYSFLVNLMQKLNRNQLIFAIVVAESLLPRFLYAPQCISVYIYIALHHEDWRHRRSEDRAKPSKIKARYSRPTCNCRTMVLHYNSTQYCSTSTSVSSDLKPLYKSIIIIIIISEYSPSSRPTCIPDVAESVVIDHNLRFTCYNVSPKNVPLLIL